MESITKAPFYNLESLKSRHGVEFMSFAKSRNFKKELYEDWVAPHYSIGDYYVETWRHGPGNLKSNCSKPFKVYNIQEISFKSDEILFNTLKDHSKWLVSDENELICVGDINRQEHQKQRGGGTVCQQAKISGLYKNLINRVEPCPRKESKHWRIKGIFLH